MKRIQPPSKLDIDSLNFADEWKGWKEAWELYRISSGLHEKDDAVQIATIQSILVIKGLLTVELFTFSSFTSNNIALSRELASLGKGML